MHTHLTRAATRVARTQKIFPGPFCSVDSESDVESPKTRRDPTWRTRHVTLHFFGFFCPQKCPWRAPPQRGVAVATRAPDGPPVGQLDAWYGCRVSGTCVTRTDFENFWTRFPATPKLLYKRETRQHGEPSGQSGYANVSTRCGGCNERIRSRVAQQRGPRRVDFR